LTGEVDASVGCQPDQDNDLFGTVLRHKEDGRKFVLDKVVDGEAVVGELGDRIIDECPVEEGDDCIDPECEGRVGETERDKETMSAHELYCYECGLNWVERGNTWDEQYVDWPTSFSYDGDSE